MWTYLRIILVFSALWASPCIAQEDNGDEPNLTETRELIFKGYWQGGNLYVRNPFSVELNSFCPLTIYVNGTIYKSKVRKSAVQIPLEGKDYAKNDLLEIKIVHNAICRPHIINKNILTLAPSEEKVEEKEEEDNFQF